MSNETLFSHAGGLFCLKKAVFCRTKPVTEHDNSKLFQSVTQLDPPTAKNQTRNSAFKRHSVIPREAEEALQQQECAAVAVPSGLKHKQPWVQQKLQSKYEGGFLAAAHAVQSVAAYGTARRRVMGIRSIHNCCITSLIYVLTTILVKHPDIICIAHYKSGVSCK